MKVPDYARSMGWFDRFRKRAAPASSVPPDAGVVSASYGLRGPPKRGTRELIAAYNESPWLRAVVGRIARGVASAEWSVYVRAAEPMRGPRLGRIAPLYRHGIDRPVQDLVLTTGGAESRKRRRRELRAAGLLREIPDHPLLKMLARPSPELTGRASLEVTQKWIDVKGEAFWLITRDGLGMPTGYLPVPPHWVLQVPIPGRRTFRISSGGMNLEIPEREVIWLREADPLNPWGRGTGVAEALADELETDEFAARYVKSWFFNSAMPSGIVAFEGAGEAPLKRAKEEWEQQHRGIGNAHRMHFASGKMNAVRLDSSFKDQQLSELRKQMRDTIAQVFAVPPEVIGVIENSNRATIDASRFIYALGVEHPRIEFLRCELQHQLATQFGEELVLEAECSMPEDAAHTLSVMSAQPAAFELNEWREEAGREPVDAFEGIFPPLAAPGQVADNPGNADAPEPKPSPVDPPTGDDDEEEPPEPMPSPPEMAAPRADPPWAAAGLDPK